MDGVAGTIAAMQERQTSAAIAELFPAITAEMGCDSFSFIVRRRRSDGRRGETIATNYPSQWRARMLAQR